MAPLTRAGFPNGPALIPVLFMKLQHFGNGARLWAALSALGAALALRAADIVDEAKSLGKTPADFPTAAYDYFRPMDQAPDENGQLRPLELAPDEIKGRNTWLMWCGGNEVFWDWLSTHSYGFMDLLKLCDFPPDDKFGGKRFGPAGLIIEPGTKPAEKPDRFGLYLRQLEDTNAPRASASVYGQSSGIVGLRLFLNPKFDPKDSRYDEKAVRRWNPERYRHDEAYFNNPDLVRPYRVGMSCAFCHASPHPLNPPEDVERPKWENLSSTIGAQYFRVSAVFGNLLKPDNFVYHLLDSQRPGTIDTSLVASDNINNANTMNALWELGARLDRSGEFAHRSPAYAQEYNSRYGHNHFETVSSETARMPVLLGAAADAWANPRPVPRVLLEGADSVGAWGALARVYLNIGTFSERWVTLHNPLVGFRKQEPFRIADCKANSVYWQVNEQRVEYLAKFFLKSTAPMRLKDAPGGKSFLKSAGVPWAPELQPGRKVFAERCIICHSSKQPNGKNGLPGGPESVPGDQLVNYLANDAYRAWALQEVEKPDFWHENFLASEHRVPVTLVKTHAGRALGSNSLTNHMWEDFSSTDYKALPAVGEITVWNPFKQQAYPWAAPGGGRGYYRPASLVSVWATAPYLHNNTVGLFNNDPSVKGRMAAFDDGIRRLLTRGKTDEEAAKARWAYNAGPAADVNSPINQATQQRMAEDHGLIWRTPVETRLHIPSSDVQALLAGVTMGWLATLVDHPWILPALFALIAALLLRKSRGKALRRGLGLLTALIAILACFGAEFIQGNLGDLDLGPIPAGTPVDLLANVDPAASKMPANIRAVIGRLKTLVTASPGERSAAINDIADKLLEISDCPDLVMDRGHYFAKDLTAQELEDLIELLKTF